MPTDTCLLIRHMPLDDPLKDFAVNAPRDKFVESALNELRKVSRYSPPKIESSSSRKVQQYNNLTSTFLYARLSRWKSMQTLHS